MKTKRMLLLAALMVAGMTQAEIVSSRAELDTLLEGNSQTDDFESFTISSQTGIGIELTSETTGSFGGPGLVGDGVTYSDLEGIRTLYVNVDSYLGLESQQLTHNGSSSGIVINFDTPMTAFGFDINNYAGYLADGTVNVYDGNSSLITSQSVSSGFFGWSDTGGISTVEIIHSQDCYINIDNNTYGVVPEPATLAFMGIFGAGALAVRRIFMM